MDTEEELVVTAKKRRPGIRLRIHPPKRRTGLQRLHARLYYRRNRAKIRLQRRKYLRTHKDQLKHRKQFQRFKPVWFKKPPKHKKPHKPKIFKVVAPKRKKH